MIFGSLKGYLGPLEIRGLLSWLLQNHGTYPRLLERSSASFADTLSPFAASRGNQYIIYSPVFTEAAKTFGLPTTLFLPRLSM